MPQPYWKGDWVIDLNIQKFFDSVDHSLMVKTVTVRAASTARRATARPVHPARVRGLAGAGQLVMHYAFDMWMAREYPDIRLERYADDAVVHCVTERQAATLVAAIGDRMEQVGPRLHPDKTKVLYCQEANRRLDYGLTAFTFLRFTFGARTARTKHGTMFVAFQPAISKEA
ncbi:reverse transcriptase domain-containing protein [Mycobacterium sp. URHB0021]